MVEYSADVERHMKWFYQSLSEKDRRRYAAIEAEKLGYGGVEYVSRLLGCDPKTIRQGRADLEAPTDPVPDRVRKEGGGPATLLEKVPLLEQNLLDVLREHTAGDPMRPEVRWTNLSLKEISRRLAEKGTPASKRVLKPLLKKLGFVKRKAHKTLTMGDHPDRDAQFQNIARLKQEYLDAGLPVLSIDTKKKELLGTFYRDGHLYSRDGVRVYDHDFPSFADGKVVPYGIYDLAANKAHVTIGTSHDTSEFACECLAQWWEQHGRERYPTATKLLLLCDGGGSNASNRHVFKEELQRLADRLGIEIRVAHYPPYCSKYNPIEHRVFPHVTRACQGVVFESAELVSDLISRTKTETGLTVTTSIMNRVFEIGRKATADFLANCRILRDSVLPKWNYRALPTPASY